MASPRSGCPRSLFGLQRRFGRDPIGGQWVTDRTCAIEWSLRQPHRNGRCIKGEAGNGAQCGKNVVGSYSRSFLPDNQVQYRTRWPSGIVSGL
jgi:hypothetical protein